MRKNSLALALFAFVLSLSTGAHANWAVNRWAGCAPEKLGDYRSSCQKTPDRRDRCHVLDSPEIYELSDADFLRSALKDSCFKEKSHACYCLTYLGATTVGDQDFDWNNFAIHGNYCGWRNAAEASKVDAVMPPVPAVDALDEVCRVHDAQYDNPQITVCQADKQGIRAMVKIARDFKLFSRQVREQSLAMAGALLENRNSCTFLRTIK